MSDEQKSKISLTLAIDRTLLERIENAIQHLPPGWDITRVFEVGAFELLEQLARKYKKGKPYPE